MSSFFVSVTAAIQSFSFCEQFNKFPQSANHMAEKHLGTNLESTLRIKVISVTVNGHGCWCWDIPTQPAIGVKKKGLKKRKYLVSSFVDHRVQMRIRLLQAQHK